ncbi:Transposon Tf2-12 polyprotein [Lasiodiplodia hormozganensis]|uniref:Transposon Tf2-12 polyprotein n=1 Tax=Lasiodiplodia hormozganensis TaxID=869390 RepID=A0AA40CHF2_9PEZI|nr:Transposon Tf2-12 polyprotein [Lasiodiplodia hormozganensis]
MEIHDHWESLAPLLVMQNLGKYDMILGLGWMEAHGVKLDLTTQSLSFKKDHCSHSSKPAPLPTPSTPAPTPKRPAFQPKRILRRSVGKNKHDWDVRDALRNMDNDLAKKENPPRSPLASNADISQCQMVSADEFSKYLKTEGMEFYRFTLEEITEDIELFNLQAALPDDLKSPLPPAENANVPDWLKEFLPDFAEELSDKFTTPPDVYHKIELEGDPDLRTPPLFRMSIEEMEAAKTYLEKNRKKGFIEPSNANFGSPVLMAKKPGGGLRFCVDYRKLNAVTKKNRYPLPLIDETLAKLQGAKFFSKIDIRQAFHKIRMHPDSKDLTSFRTRWGSYRYNVMPFGLCNGPSTFQHYVNEAMMDCLDKFCAVYIDDIIVYSKTRKEHREHVKEVLTRLRKAGLQPDPKKCEFEVTETKFLGLIVTRDGIKMDPVKVKAILDWEAPKTLHGVQSFLGLCNYYRRFVRGYSIIAKPLTDLTKKDQGFQWSPQCQAAFEALKQAMSSDPVLKYFDPTKTIYIEVDSSDYVSGGFMMQKDDEGRLHPVAYFSKKLSPTECNYTIYDKELLAIVRAFEEWRPECVGTAVPIQVFSDHETLKSFLQAKKLSRRQVRYALMLQDYNFEILPIPGKENLRADALSRREQDLPQSEEDERVLFMNRPLLNKSHFPLLAPLQLPVDPLVERLREANKNHPSLQAHREKAQAGDEDLLLTEGLLTFKGRLLVPDDPALQLELLQEAHDKPATGHPGERRTIDLLRERYCWTGMRTQIKQYVRNCHSCKRAKASRNKYHGLLRPIPLPYRPWTDLTCDFVVRLPPCEGYDAVLVVVDRFSKMRHFIPCETGTSAAQLARLFKDHIWKLHGLPESIISDRGAQFVSKFWKELCKLLRIDVKLSTAYHPETDGQSENSNQSMETYLRQFTNYHQDDWVSWLSSAEYSANANTSAASTVSPFFAVYGYEPRLSFDWTPTPRTQDTVLSWNRQQANDMAKKMEEIWAWCKTRLEENQRTQAKNANRHRKDVTFEIGDRVFLSTRNIDQGRPSRKLSWKYIGPFTIKDKAGLAYKLDLPPGLNLHPVMHVSKLLKDPNDALEGQVQEPPPPIEIEGENEWVVEQILDSRKKRGRVHYRVQWGDYPPDPQWYPAHNFDHAARKLKSFHDKYPDKPGPPPELKQ